MTKIISKVDLETARKLGLKHYCTGKPCRYGHVAKRLVSNRSCVECCKEKTQQWIRRSGEHIRLYARQLYQKNKVVKLAKQRQWRIENQDKVRQIKKAEYEKNKQRYQESSRRYRLTHADEMKEYHRRKALANPEQYAAYKRNRKARVRAAKGSHTGEQVLQLLKLQNGRCIYCKDKIAKGFHVDHIEPIIRGGSNDITNLQLLCQPCNQSKSAKDPLKFAQERGLLL